MGKVTKDMDDWSQKIWMTMTDDVMLMSSSFMHADVILIHDVTLIHLK